MDGKTIMEVVLEAANDAKADKITMDKLESLALPQVQALTPAQIRQLREQSKLSRSVWAKVLNVGVTTAQKWESGKTRPDGAALKLLNLVRTHGVTTLL
ncbi:MAG TPA: helix-turn-helix domain-containing protein [Candidatus Saccharimonadales bacterium]|jgi:putative transcriptional regulator|nr:helix-turn-helix domain-containing protein [Candidatus Saccharimonadales bacterium]